MYHHPREVSHDEPAIEDPATAGISPLPPGERLRVSGTLGALPMPSSFTLLHSSSSLSVLCGRLHFLDRDLLSALSVADTAILHSSPLLLLVLVPPSEVLDLLLLGCLPAQVQVLGPGRRCTPKALIYCQGTHAATTGDGRSLLSWPSGRHSCSPAPCIPILG